MEPNPQEPRILLADIQPIFREGIAAIILQRHPRATFGHADSFREAHEKMLAQKWHLIVCDINLSDRNGFELIQAARHLAVPIPTLVLSANPVQIYGRGAVKCGAASYLPKETPAQELLSAINLLLQGQRYINRRLALVLADATDENSEKFLHDTLSQREMQVLLMLADGKSLKKIAARLSLNPKTVSTYRARLTEKLKLNSDAALVKYCLKHNLISSLNDPMPGPGEPHPAAVGLPLQPESEYAQRIDEN